MNQCSYIESTDGTHLAVTTDGPPDAPITVVFAHGLALSRRVWMPQRWHLSRQIAGQARLVFYDQRGHGNSHEAATSDRNSYSVAQLGDDLNAVITHTCPTGPVVAVGHSLGGMAILSMAHHHPRTTARLTGAALISTAAYDLSASGIGRALNSPAVAMLERIADHAPRLTQSTLKFIRTAIGPIFGIPVTRLATGTDVVSIRALVGILTALRHHDETLGLDALRAVPRCVVACGQADPVTPLHHSISLAKALPHARLMSVPAAGHMLPIERPHLVSDAIAEMVNATALDVGTFALAPISAGNCAS